MSDDIVVYDTQGKMYFVNTVWMDHVNEVEVDMTTLIKGEYLIRVQVDDNYELIRIIKMQ